MPYLFLIQSGFFQKKKVFWQYRQTTQQEIILIMEGLSPLAIRRINNELNQINENPPTNWKVIKQSQNHWDIWITTQIDTPFHSIPFKMIVKFSNNYPKEKPDIRIEQFQKFYHPNISILNGGICLTTLREHQPTDTIRTKINTFIEFLGVPNLDHGLNSEALKLYQTNFNEYYKTALRKFRGLK